MQYQLRIQPLYPLLPHQNGMEKGVVVDTLNEILQPISQDIQGNLVFSPGGLVDNIINSLVINRLPIKMTGRKDAPIVHMYIQMGNNQLCRLDSH